MPSRKREKKRLFTETDRTDKTIFFCKKSSTKKKSSVAPVNKYLSRTVPVSPSMFVPGDEKAPIVPPSRDGICGSANEIIKKKDGG